MIVCLCRAVSDRQVRSCISGGASSTGAVSRACGAGSGCGGCVPTVRALIAQTTFDQARLSGVTAQRDGGQVNALAVACEQRR